MTRCCSVPGCIGGKGGSRFPKDPKLFLKWQVAIKRLEPGPGKKLWTPKQHSVVCHKHFKPEDYRVPVCSTVPVGGKRVRLLKPEAVPSIFPHSGKDERKARRSEERARRLERRRFESALAEEINPDDLVGDLVVEPEVVLQEVSEVDRESLPPSSTVKGLNWKPVEASVVQGLKLRPVSPSEVAHLVRRAKVKSDPETVTDLINEYQECLDDSILEDIPEPIKNGSMAKKKTVHEKGVAASDMSTGITVGAGAAIIFEPSEVLHEVFGVDEESLPSSRPEPRNKKANTVNEKICHAVLNDKRIPRTKEDKKKEFQCPECLKKFAGMGVLKLHIMRIHSNVRSFICGQCGKGFKSKGELGKHEVTHGKNTIQCGKKVHKDVAPSDMSPEITDGAGATILLITDGASGLRKSSEATSPAEDQEMDNDHNDYGMMDFGQSKKSELNETSEGVTGIVPSDEEDDEDAAFFKYMATQTRKMRKRDKRAFFREIQDILPKFEREEHSGEGRSS